MHPLAAAVARETPGQADRIRWGAEAGARVDALVQGALECPDPAQARVALAAALRGLYQHALPFRGTPGAELWLLETHRRLYARAGQLFGAEGGHVVQPPVEPLTTPAGGRGPYGG
jgi:hypothetical protein